jgi:hypothetical protein
MSRWKIVPSARDIVVREHDWTAEFDCHNLGTDMVVKIEMTQQHGGPVTDLIGALKALAQVLVKAAANDYDETGGKPETNRKLN